MKKSVSKIIDYILITLIIALATPLGVAHYRSWRMDKEHSKKHSLMIKKQAELMAETAAEDPVQVEKLISEEEWKQLEEERKNIPIALLQTKDKLIIVKQGENELLFTVESAEGVLIASELTKEELRQEYPELSRRIDRGVADWAGMDAPEVHAAPVKMHNSTITVIDE